MVGELLRDLGYSLQANTRAIEGDSHPDRNAQFEHIHQTVQGRIEASLPVISVDTKKKELVGNFKNADRELRPKGEPVRVHGFVNLEPGAANLYGVDELAHNEGWVSVCVDHETIEFTVESIRRWWYGIGRPLYPGAKQLLITADGGGSNGSRARLWEVELQKLADELRMAIDVCHLPPGTSKWNKIEHHMFSFITQNWREKPLVSHEVIIKLIAATTNKEGLNIACKLDPNTYPPDTKISDKEMVKINITKNEFHGEWNYSILPH